MNFHLLIRIVKTIYSFFSKENLLLTGALFSFCYAGAQIFLIGLSFSDETMKGSFFTFSTTLLHIIFTLILALNLNTIHILYRFIGSTRKTFMRIVYYATIGAWLFYLFTPFNLTLSRLEFISYFSRQIQHPIDTGNWLTIVVFFIFGIGLSLLFIEYYRQLKMKYLLYFIVPSLLFFSFKTMFPFLFSVLAWLMYCGCQLLLYFSIYDIDPYKSSINKNTGTLTGYAGPPG